MTAYWQASFKGVRAFCTAYVNDQDAEHTNGAVMLSLVGNVTALNGLWAAFLSNETLLVDDQTPLRRIRKPDDDPTIKTLAQKSVSDYRTLSARLRETGKRHMVIVHHQATQDCEMDRAFFVLHEPEGTLPLARFYQQFTRAVAVCARPEWSEYLWQRGLDMQLVTSCDARGIQAWRVAPDGDAWAELIQTGLVNKTIV